MDRKSLSSATKSFTLVFITILLLPLSLALSSLALLTQQWPSHMRRFQQQKQQRLGQQHRRTVLVTGVGMAKGLTLARAFYLNGHRVIGADFETRGIPCSGRFSKSLSAFRAMEKPGPNNDTRSYVSQLFNIVQEEGVDLWVSCSGVASALEDAKAKEFVERETSCKCIQLGVNETATLHEKDSFMREAENLGLPVPNTHDVVSSDDALRILLESQAAHRERKFILKTVDVDDANRGNMTLLPLGSKKATKDHVSRLSITPEHPWILQEFIPGGEEYCTHALIVRGQIKCFVACPSAELLMHYRALPRTSSLSRAMLAFTREYVFRSPNPELFTGHLSFDFMVKDIAVDEKSIERSIYAIECNPRAHTAVALFAQDGPETTAMIQAYLSTLDETPDSYAGVLKQNGLREDSIVYPTRTALPRYWIGHDLFSLVFYPVLQWMMGQGTLRQLSGSCIEFLDHVLNWKEGTFEVWDPLPALVLYHVYWPLTILSAWWNGFRWSRVNVSTTKIFGC
ncbi:putative Carbamoylphosphate synthase large subunit [Seiridium cardinale]